MEQKLKIQQTVYDLMPQLISFSDYIWHHPEYNFHEFKSSSAFAGLLSELGFQVETGIGGLATAVRAEYDSRIPGPHIAFLGEYDAVPGMGHACGHNLIAAMAIGAGAALKSVINETGGKVSVIGTPAEEGGGGKVILLENGVFDDFDAVLILHPANETVVNDISYSKTDLVVDFYGKKAHAATWPEEGVSALTPVLELFNLINAMRLEIADRGKILGVITKGGDEPIMIPDHCQAAFTVRSFDDQYKRHLFDKLIKTCEGLAAITGTRFEYQLTGPIYEDIRNNPVLERILEKNFTELGEIVGPRRKELGIGTTDVGNVTHRIPALQSYIIVAPLLRGHTPEFEAAVGGPLGHETIRIGAAAMAMTAWDLLKDPTLQRELKETFQRMKAQYGWEGSICPK